MTELVRLKNGLLAIANDVAANNTYENTENVLKELVAISDVETVRSELEELCLKYGNTGWVLEVANRILTQFDALADSLGLIEESSSSESISDSESEATSD